MQGQGPGVGAPRPRVQDGTRARHVSGHLAGIDSLRFVCALAVMLSHVHPFRDLLQGEGKPLAVQILVAGFNGLFNGPAAVIVFFVISGFCIHYPYREGRKVVLPAYLSARMLRIVPPAVVHMLVVWYVMHDAAGILETVLWSVVCEAVYYALYPGLLWLRRRSSWELLIGLAYAVAAVALATHLPAVRADLNQYLALGWGTWVLGLPCWLLGCWLAENFRRLPVPSRAGVWGSRALLLGSFVVLHAVQSHGTSVLASNCFTLDVFAPVAAWCFAREVLYAESFGAWHLLERAGRWSYSLYLVHPLVVPVLSVWGLGWFARGAAWHPLVLGLVLVLSYGFFWVVERPSHVVAVRVGRWLGGRSVKAFRTEV